jgi:hypothetical protein
MGERYGADRLEAACTKAMAINNPKYKSVEAILKTGLDKACGKEEVSATTVSHGNIRGGAYFDRKEVDASPDLDAIEARYLEEERTSIIQEPRVGPEVHPKDTGHTQQQGATDALASTTDAKEASAEPLPVMIGRLRARWSAPGTPQQNKPPKRYQVRENEPREDGVHEERSEMTYRMWTRVDGLASGNWLGAVRCRRGVS